MWLMGSRTPKLHYICAAVAIRMCVMRAHIYFEFMCLCVCVWPVFAEQQPLATLHIRPMHLSAAVYSLFFSPPPLSCLPCVATHSRRSCIVDCRRTWKRDAAPYHDRTLFHVNARECATIFARVVRAIAQEDKWRRTSGREKAFARVLGDDGDCLVGSGWLHAEHIILILLIYICCTIVYTNAHTVWISTNPCGCMMAIYTYILYIGTL